MDSSPESTASSDLYPPSESSEPAKPEEPLLDASAKVEDQPPGIPHIGQDEAQDTEYSDTMQGLESSGDEESEPSSIVPSPILNGIPPGSSHKRKRDEVVQLGSARQEILTSTNLGQTIDETDSNRSTSRLSLGVQVGTSTGNKLGTKRTKTGDHASRSDIGAQLFSKSSALPAVLWQHILCYVPPVFLGNLLRVNHAFNSYLTPGIITEDRRELPNSRIQPLTAEEIWAASRRRFAPGLPRPIQGFQELDMWRLLRGRDCQLCHQTKAVTPAADTESPWESGPGYSGVRVIWPFGVRCCGECLQNESRKELDLFYSSDFPSFLLPALPFAFVSDGNHYVRHNILRNTSAPPTNYPTKRYYNPHLEDVKHQCEDVKDLGAGPAEEWTKGLAGQGQRRMEDAIRWEQWESKGGLKKLNMPRQLKIANKAISVKVENHSDRSTPQSMLLPTRREIGQAGPAPISSMEADPFIPSAATPPLQHPWNSGAGLQFGMQQGSQVPLYQPRPERSIQHVNEAKAARKAEIERRCAALEPPLLPNVLGHMESFQAAMQITQPMTDQAWQVLKPRLLAQLPYAERKENERVQHNEVLEEKYKAQRQLEARLKETKENSDREWEAIQAPVRDRIGTLADEIIENKWAGSSNITKDTSPKFAADVLLGVRQSFYTAIAQEDKAAHVAGKPIKIDSSSDPPTRMLILENMKWLFDTKVKPLTDHFQRELFLCNGCNGNFKFYGFEGVIQHYAAKHTSELSRGNVVVNWRAEWPEDPPFNPNPSVAKAAYYKIPTPATPIPIPSTRETQGPGIYGAHSQNNAAQTPTGVQYSATIYPSSYVGPHQQTPHTVPAQPYPTLQPTYAPGTGYPGHPAAHNGYGGIPPQYNSYSSAQHVPVTQTYSSSYPIQQPYPAFVNGQPGPSFQGYFPGPNANGYGGAPYPPNLSNGHMPQPVLKAPVQMADPYQRQMDEMAKHAKDVFTGIGGVKDLPGSVRIFVVIQHTVSRFKVAFSNEPSLSMFIDGLDHNPVMRPVRSVNGLGCKTCIQSGTSAKLFTLPHLVSHFRTTHVGGSQALGYTDTQELDWKYDMIDLPEKNVISNLASAQGMSDSKLGLIAWVFPEAFPSSFPNVRGRMNAGPLPVYRKEFDVNSRPDPTVTSNPTNDLSTRVQYSSSAQHYSRPDSGFRPQSEGASSGPVEPPGEDEYDPHRPAYLGKILNLEPDSSHSRKPARLSALHDGQQPSFHGQHELQQYKSQKHVVDERHSDAPALRSKLSEGYSGRPYESIQHIQQPQSPRPIIMSRSGNGTDMRDSEHEEPQRQEHLNGDEAPSSYEEKYRRAPKIGNIDDSLKPLLRVLRHSSPLETASAADQFLSNLAPNQNKIRSQESHTADGEIDRRSDVPWLAESPAMRRPMYFGEDGASDRRHATRTNGRRQHDDPTPERIHADHSESRNGNHRITQRRPRSQSPSLDGHRSASHMQIPLKSLRADDDTLVRYVPYETTSPSYIHDREQATGSTRKRSLSGGLSHQTARISQYRDSPSVPLRPSPENALYRPQSPVEEDRDEAIYHVHSSLHRRQERPQRVVSYDYPTQTQYEYIDDRRPQEDHQPRIQYIKYEDLGPREPTRYIVARPVEHLEPQYVRYERTYTEEPIYERSGSVYRAPPRTYQEQPARIAQPLPQGYEEY